MNVNELVADLGEDIKTELSETVEIVEHDEWPKSSEIYIESRKWARIEDVVVVAGDLKNSTQLGFNKYVKTSASIYEAAMTSSVKVLAKFDPRFVDIQGDGFFALFHGQRAVERGLCAAVTLKTLSDRELGPQLTEETDDNVPTGLKLGMDRGVLAVKKVGVRGDHNERVWAGKPVNWAFKCAQAADRDELIVTSRVWSKLSDNEYVTHSCDCSDYPSEIWLSSHVETLPSSEQHVCRKLISYGWCEHCGDGFAQHILDGDKKRNKVGFNALLGKRRAG